MEFDYVMVKGKVRGLKSKAVGSMVFAETSPEEFAGNFALNLGKEVGEFNLSAMVCDTPCAQAPDRIVKVCKEAVKAQSYRPVEKAFPGCLITDKHGNTFLSLNVDPVPEHRPAPETSNALYHANKGTRGKEQRQVCLLRDPTIWRLGSSTAL